MTKYNMYLFNEEEFNEFRAKHPQLRYFQAMCTFLHVDRIEVVYADDGEYTREDTFYWQDDNSDGTRSVLKNER